MAVDNGSFSVGSSGCLIFHISQRVKSVNMEWDHSPQMLILMRHRSARSIQNRKTCTFMQYGLHPETENLQISSHFLFAQGSEFSCTLLHFFFPGVAKPILQICETQKLCLTGLLTVMDDEISLQEDAIVESREAVMVSPVGNSIPTSRLSHFLKPRNLSTSSIEGQVHLKHPLLFPSSAPLFCHGKKWPLQVGFMGWQNPNPKWKSWVDHLSPSYQSVWREAGIYEAILGSTCSFRKDDGLIMAMAEKWCPETNTFVFPWGEATVTLEDAMILGGLPVSGHPFFACDCDGRELKQIEKKLVEVAGRIQRRSTTDEDFQNEWMRVFMCSGIEIEHEAFLSLWLERFVLNDSEGSPKASVFPIALHLARAKPVGLASAVLANIYRDMSLLKATIVSASQMETSEPDAEVMAVNLWSSLHLVQLWAWERFPKLRPTPNPIQKDEPRSFMWDNLRSRRVRDLRLALDSAGDTFSWRPYAVSLNGWQFPDFYRGNGEWLDMESNESLLPYSLCLRVSELVGQGCVEQYLPHRVAMQFGMDQDLPHNVDPSNECPEWLFEPDVTVGYLNWWREPMLSSEGLLKDAPIANGLARRRRTPSKRRKLAHLYSSGDLEANITPQVAQGVLFPSGLLTMSREVKVEKVDDDNLLSSAKESQIVLRKLVEVKAETNYDDFDYHSLGVSRAKESLTSHREELLLATPVKHASAMVSSAERASSSEDSMETKPVIPADHLRHLEKIGGDICGDKSRSITELAVLDRLAELERALAELKATQCIVKVERD
ncbi:unnamed protein product [Linum tenue]|uniref:Aminotransferase-like plant mobile domain-containing protein n=1 Tax=Linum tenue TaxID=586396 RepID=A0AAV0H4R2_9ROSI|nr:unnamed protein product [Linum tenue]